MSVREKSIVFSLHSNVENNLQFINNKQNVRRILQNISYITHMTTSKENRSIFSKKLIRLRKLRDMTQSQFAEALGVPRHQVAYFETAAHNPTVDTLHKMATFFNVRVEYFLYDDDEAFTPSKPGPDSELEKRIRELRKLPRSHQKLIISMLDGVLSDFESVS